MSLFFCRIAIQIQEKDIEVSVGMPFCQTTDKEGRSIACYGKLSILVWPSQSRSQPQVRRIWSFGAIFLIKLTYTVDLIS